MKKFVKYLPYLIIFLGLLFRVYKGAQGFLYSHDNDLAGWIINDIVIDKHPRLIGQETSTQGIFIGPLFYYYLIPFYMMFRMDPIGGVWAVTLLGIITVASFIFCLSKVFGRRVGIIAGFIYAVSYYMIFNDREVVPTMPVMLWSVWYFYSINLILQGKVRGYLLVGFLTGLIWHLNMALVLLLPLIPLAVLMSKKKISWVWVGRGALILFIVSIPLVFFEVRHGFLQTNALLTSLTTGQHDIISGYAKFQRVMLLAGKNVKGFVFGPKVAVSYSFSFLLMILTFFYLSFKKKIKAPLSILMIFWIVLYTSFFSLYSKILSEYYLNGMMVIWVVVLSRAIDSLFESKNDFLGIILIITYFGLNVSGFFGHTFHQNGYLQRKALVSEIKRDAKERGFPCIAVSYITNPGYDFGYRYFYYLENLHVNHPESGSPVYTIVFPLKPIFPVDKTFGAIGLIYPDYKRYTKEGIGKSCSGENSNLTDPMFGYTE